MASPGPLFEDIANWLVTFQAFLPVLVNTSTALTDAFLQIVKNVLMIVGAWTLLRAGLRRRRGRSRGS